MTVPLLIDTDVALGVEHEGRPRDVDDGFAIVEALNAPDIELLGITTVFGNAPHEAVHRVGRQIVELKSAEVPVVPGAAAALPRDGELPPANAAVAFLAAALRERPAHVAAIGPLTNLGLLAHHHPDVLGNVLSVIAVAGRTEGKPFYIGEAGPVQDFNFESDPRAARLLLESGVPVVLAGFELTSRVAVTEADLEAIRQLGTATADYLHRNSLAWCRYWTGRFPADAGFHPWDSAAISWLRHPEYFVTEARGWRISEAPTAETADAAGEGNVGADPVGAAEPGSAWRSQSERTAEPGSAWRSQSERTDPWPRTESSRSRPGGRSYSGYWLETHRDYPAPRLTYCTGFTERGARAFVRDVVTTVY